MPKRPTKIVKTFYRYEPRGGRRGNTKYLVFLCDNGKQYSKNDMGEITGMTGDLFYRRWRNLNKPRMLSEVERLNKPIETSVDEGGRLPTAIVKTYLGYTALRTRVLAFLCDNDVAYTRDALGAFLGITGSCFYQRWKKLDKPDDLDTIRDPEGEGGATEEYLALTGEGKKTCNVPEPTEFDRLYGMGG